MQKLKYAARRALLPAARGEFDQGFQAYMPTT
jgi:hypothetical protein